MKNLTKSTLMIITVVLLGTGCSDKVESRMGIDPALKVKAPSHIAQAFEVQSLLDSSQPISIESTVNRFTITILKSALEKEFLFQPELTVLDNAPNFHSLKSRIVAFRQRGGRLYLLEATQGHWVTNELPMSLILAEFQIQKETDASITFDFNEGMKNIYNTSEFWASDFMGTEYKAPFESIPVKLSYLDYAGFNSRNELLLRQVLQWNKNSTEGSQTFFSIIQYYLSPYQPEQSFTPSKASDFNKMGFFEVSPQLRLNSTSIVRATKMNSQKPIVYAISSNTPSEYRDAIRDGVLYWNKSLGQNKVQVVMAPEGVTAPNGDYNMIQWVTWDDAGGAYADIQVDPRSGEIRHAQIFLPSTFAMHGKEGVRKLLRKGYPLQPMDSAFGIQKRTKAPLARLCELSADDIATNALSPLLDLLAPNTNNEMILKTAQNYVREVTAHEVGHTLGLRHNFAGSLASNLKPEERKATFVNYLKTGTLPEKLVTTSSIMDYLKFEESVLTGAQLATSAPALQYDEKAMATLYGGASYTTKEIPPFCTDAQRGRLLDCEIFDAGAYAIEALNLDFNNAMENIPYLLIDSYISQRFPSNGAEPKTIEEINLSTRFLSYILFTPRYELYKILTTSAHFLSVQRSYPFISETNEAQVRLAELNFITKLVDQAGGLNNNFGSHPSDFEQTIFKKVEYLLDEKGFGKGISSEGIQYELSPYEIAVIKTNIKSTLDSFKDNMAKEELSVLSGDISPILKEVFMKMGVVLPANSSKLVDHPLTVDFSSLLESRMEEYLLSTKTGETQFAEVEAQGKADPEPKIVKVTLPMFTYSRDIRSMAATLLRSERAEAPEWGLSEKSFLHAKYQALIEKSLDGNPIESFKIEKMPKPVARWLIEAKRVLKNLETSPVN